MDANSIKEKNIRKFFEDIQTKNKTSITSNSLKIITYAIKCLSDGCGLFIIGNNSYQLYKEVGLITSKKCLYIDTLYETEIYPKELNRGSSKETKKTEQRIGGGGIEIFFCEDNPGKRKVHVKNQSKKRIMIKKGDNISKKSFMNRAFDMGYENTDTTRYVGEISDRGGVVDVFAVNTNNPIRIEFFGNNIDTIRYYNPTSQLSIKEIESINIRSYKKSIKPIKSITYEEYIVNNKYKLLYVSVVENKYILSNSSGKIINNNHIINTTPITSNKKIEKLSKDSMLYLDKENAAVEKGVKIEKNRVMKNRFVYEKLNGGEVLKYKRSESYNYNYKTVQKDANIHKYKWGDYITHEDFGVGVYRGIISKNKYDYINIEYKDGSSVMVSTLKIHKICPYVGVPKPLLNSINDKKWNKKIQTTKTRIHEIINEMVVISNNRNRTRENEIVEDKYIDSELEKSFPYVETYDQKKAINDVYKDMSLPGLMDRIIIGDVGFGKTEVAIRASVRSVCSGGFVIVVVPTTILADQHYISFRGRLEKLGINVRMLSRFVSKKLRVKICNEILNKTVDILIGTHAVLSDDIPKKRLSLIVIDEEHKFGVAHKNKLLKIRQSLDVLTLSATPIPRTLQQSLLGIRDVTLIQTPPINRLPIKTRVLYKKWPHLKKLVERELFRDGQVYFVHNKIETLPVVYERLNSLFPNTNIAMAHGQMPSNELEEVVLSFFDGRVKILVCTSIIESGLDVTNANTILINDSHFFGLSQLYQIRGRVGRGNQQAYCYLIIPDINSLSKEAVERLRALESSVDLGSGYNIALKDLEIRGSGNLFGYEQSGSVDKVGYHLYCKMFEQALETDKRVEFGVGSLKISTFFNSSFEESYMPLSEDRIYFYQRLAVTLSRSGLDKIQSEVIDRFGVLSVGAKNMFYVSQLRIVYNMSLVSKVDINRRSVVLSLNKNESVFFSNYFERLIDNLSRAAINHSFKHGNHDSLYVEIPVGLNVAPIEKALKCAEYFIYNKKND